MVEVSVSLETGRPIFEPHAHFIIAGPTRNQLRAARRVLPKRSTRIQVVTSVQGLCLYVSKFAAEERSAYIGDDGKRRRRRNGMRPAEKTAWLSWLAQYGVEDLIIEGGFQPNLKTMFRNAEMGELLDRLVGRVSPNGPKMLSIRQLRP